MGYLYALLAAVLFGLNGSVTKTVVQSGITPLQLTQFRVLGTAILAGVVLLATDRRSFRVTPRQLGSLAILGVLGVALLQATYAAALQLLPVGITLLIEYTAVLMVALVSFFFLGARIRSRVWVAIGCVLVGLAIVARVWNSHLDGLGVLLAVAAAVTLALYFLIGERQASRMSPLAVSFWTMLFAAVFWAFFSGWWTLAPSALTTPVSLGGTLSGVVVPVWIPLVWNVALGTFAPFWLSFQALRRLSATAAGVVATSEVVFAFVFAWLWLRETLDALQIAGAAIVVLGIVLAQTSRDDAPIDADLALTPRSNTSSKNVGGST